MEGLDNPDKLEALWEQSKAKKLWYDRKTGHWINIYHKPSPQKTLFQSKNT